MMSRNVQSLSVFICIRNERSQGMLVDTLGYEKTGPPFIGIEDLKAIGRIIGPIKGRIQAAITSLSIPGSLGAGLAVGSYAAFSQTGSAYLAQYQEQGEKFP